MMSSRGFYFFVHSFKLPVLEHCFFTLQKISSGHNEAQGNYLVTAIKNHLVRSYQSLQCKVVNDYIKLISTLGNLVCLHQNKAAQFATISQTTKHFGPYNVSFLFLNEKAIA